MGIPIQPAPYVDPYITQISKSKIEFMQSKHPLLRDTWSVEEIATKIIQKLMRNTFVIGSFVSIAFARIMKMGLIKMVCVLSVREFASALDAPATIWLYVWKAYICS